MFQPCQENIYCVELDIGSHSWGCYCVDVSSSPVPGWWTGGKLTVRLAILSCCQSWPWAAWTFQKIQNKYDALIYDVYCISIYLPLSFYFQVGPYPSAHWLRGGLGSALTAQLRSHPGSCGASTLRLGAMGIQIPYKWNHEMFQTHG